MGLVALVAGAGLGVALPAVAPVGAAPPDTASVAAYDNGWNAGGGSTSANVAPGGTVTFSYPSGASFHNVAFPDLQPSSCTQTAGANTGDPPPLPATAQGPGWSGTCTFGDAGTYQFVCGLHGASMRGSVVVGDAPTPTGPTTGTGPSGTTPTYTTPTGTTPTNTTPGGNTPAGTRTSFRRLQRGSVVRGVVTTPVPRSHVALRALVAKRLLAAQRTRRVTVAKQAKRSDASGRARFALRVNRAARRALARRGRLTVLLRVAVTPPGGRPAIRTTTVTLRDS